MSNASNTQTPNYADSLTATVTTYRHGVQKQVTYTGAAAFAVTQAMTRAALKTGRPVTLAAGQPLTGATADGARVQLRLSYDLNASRTGGIQLSRDGKPCGCQHKAGL